MVCVEAVAYYRTSSGASIRKSENRVKDLSDSLERQQGVVRTYAAREGIRIVKEYYDAGVSGCDPVHIRPEFCRMMTESFAKMILVENASRFARDLMVQEVGHQMLKDRGIELISVDDPDAFTEDTPTGILIRQILGAVSQFEKSTVTKRMRSGLDRVARENGRRMEGNHGFRATHPEVKALARAIKADAPEFTVRDVSELLSIMGYQRENGKPLHPMTVHRYLSSAYS